MVRASRIDSTDELLNRLWRSTENPACLRAGRGAEPLGLRGRVERETLKNLLEGRSPEGHPTFPRPSSERQLGVDFVIDAPKSVSVLWALGPDVQDGRVLGCARAAAEYASYHVEGALSWEGGANHPTGKDRKAAVLAVIHENVSPSWNPGLHSHIIAANFDGRLDRMNEGTMSRIQHHLDFVYNQELRSLLGHNLGLVTESYHGGFRVSGVPKAVCEHFSREECPQFSVPNELFHCWRNEAAAVGWGPKEAAELFHLRSGQK